MSMAERAPQLQLAVEYLPLDAVKPYAGNARTHPKRQVDVLVKSIQAAGFTNPLLVDEEGVLIAGHGRLLAAKRLEMDKAPVIRLVGLSDMQKRALRLADNRIALDSGWNNELLKIELHAITIEASPLVIEATGFSVGEIDMRLHAAPDPDDEAIPSAPARAWARPGDIVVLGEHRIGCGDARDSDFLRRVMGEEVLADAAFLDAPYNVSIQGHANTTAAHPEFAMASGEMTKAAFDDFLKASLGAAVGVSRDGAVHFICMDWRHGAQLQAVGEELYSGFLNLCVWNKSNAGMGSLYRSKHELIYVFKVGAAPYFNAVELGRHGRNRTNVWDYPSVNTFDAGRRADLKLHPTVKSVAMVADAIKDVTRRGEVVLDSFLGVGTTLLAAERAGRRCRGVEIEPNYVNIAIDRWVEMTGAEPTVLKPVLKGWTRHG